MNARVLLAAAGGAAILIPSIFAQAPAHSPAPHRIELVTRPKRPPTAPSRGPQIRAAVLPGLYDWLGEQKIATALTARAGVPVTVLADDVTFRDVVYALRGARHLVVVARTLHVEGRGSVDISAEPNAAGGNVTILAARLRCAPGAALRVTSNGGNSTTPGGIGMAGGSLVFAVDEIERSSAPQPMAAAIPRAQSPAPRPASPSTRRRPQTPPPPPAPRPPVSPWSTTPRTPLPQPSTTKPVPPPTSIAEAIDCVTFASTGGRGLAKHTTYTEPGGRQRVRVDPPRHGEPGRVTRFPSRDAAAKTNDDVRAALSHWTVAALRQMQLAILDADATENYVTLGRLFSRYRTFETPTSVHPKYQGEYASLRAELNRYREDVLPPAFPRELCVTSGGLSQCVHVFTESSPIRQTIAPTHMLSTSLEMNGRSVLGVVQFDRARPEDLTLDTELELTVDPWLQALAMAQAKAEGESLDGMFSGWMVKARPIEEMGIKESQVTVMPGGRRMRVRLVLDGQKAAMVFWKLFSASGIPLTFDWEYRAPKGRSVSSGTWVGPALSLARRTSHTLRVEQGQVKNVGVSPQSIEYVGLDRATFAVLSRAVRIDPGQAVAVDKLGIPAPAPALWIPPQAVVAALDPLDVERTFYVVNGAQFIEQVALTNLLPAHDAESGGALQYVELYLALGVQGPGERDGMQAGPYRLSAAHTTGSEIRLPFLRPGKGAERVLVWGAAFYANGCQTIAPTTFDSWIVKITPSMLVKNRAAAVGVTQSPCAK